MTDILQEASELINGQRAKDYGPVTDNFGRIADLFWAYLGGGSEGGIGDQNIDQYDVANLMILVKLARLKNAGYHRDSYADIAGYAALAEKVYDEANPVRPKRTQDTQDFWDDIDAGIVEAQQKRERETTSRPPRVWGSISDIPEGAVAEDNRGWHWKVEGSQSLSSTNGKHWSNPQPFYPSENEYGPFTEVLDIERKGSE